jgi:hypothetical protein
LTNQKNSHLCSPQRDGRKERKSENKEKIPKNKKNKILEKKKRFLPLQTQTEGNAERAKKK